MESLAPPPAEILAADGEDPPSTLQAAQGRRARLLPSPKGRAVQMNLAATASSQPVLLFLHADTRLPAEALRLACAALEEDGVAAGAFRLAFDQRSPGLELIARAANLRTRRTRVPYGDQALFIRRRDFFAMGGFPEIPIMEDLVFMTRLRDSGRGLHLLDEPAVTSARRWRAEGLVRCTARNWTLRLLHHAGVSPNRLARYYR